MSGNERMIYLSVGTVDLAVSIFNVGVLIGVRALKEPPSDILLVLTTFSIVRTLLIDTTISIHLLTQSTMHSALLPLHLHPISTTFAWQLDF